MQKQETLSGEVHSGLDQCGSGLVRSGQILDTPWGVADRLGVGCERKEEIIHCKLGKGTNII